MHLLHGPKVPGQQVLEVPMGAGEEPFPQADQVHLLDHSRWKQTEALMWV